MSEQDVRGYLRKQGIDLGQKRESLGEVLAFLSGQEVFFTNRTTVSRVRSGDISGVEMLERLYCREILGKEGKVEAKNDYLLDLAGAVWEQRVERIFGPNTENEELKRPFVTEGLTDMVAQNLGINAQGLRRWWRCVRVELAMEATFCPSEELNKMIVDMGEEAIYRYTSLEVNFPSQVRRPMADLDGQWDRTAKGFYRAVYESFHANRALGLLMPVEASYFVNYFSRRIEQGSKPSVLDQFLLERYAEGGLYSRLARQIRKVTGVPVGREILPAYRRLALLEGREE